MWDPPQCIQASGTLGGSWKMEEQQMLMGSLLLLLCLDTTLAYISALKGGRKVLETWSMAWPTMLKSTTAATAMQLWCYSRKVTKESLCPGSKCWEASLDALTHGCNGALQLAWRGCCLSKAEKVLVLPPSLWLHHGAVSYLVMSRFRKPHASSWAKHLLGVTQGN